MPKYLKPYALEGGVQEVTFFQGAKLLSVALLEGRVALIALVDTASPAVLRTIHVAGLREMVKDGPEYIGCVNAELENGSTFFAAVFAEPERSVVSLFDHVGVKIS